LQREALKAREGEVANTRNKSHDLWLPQACRLYLRVQKACKKREDSMESRRRIVFLTLFVQKGMSFCLVKYLVDSTTKNAILVFSSRPSLECHGRS
jgi:hypothetical protein